MILLDDYNLSELVIVGAWLLQLQCTHIFCYFFWSVVSSSL